MLIGVFNGEDESFRFCEIVVLGFFSKKGRNDSVIQEALYVV